MALPEMDEWRSANAEQISLLKENRDRLTQVLQVGHREITDSITNGFGAQLKLEKLRDDRERIQAGFMLEALREAGKDKGAPAGKEVKGAASAEDVGGWGLLLAGAAALIGGVIRGLVDSLKLWAKLIKATVRGVTKGTAAIIKLIFKPITNLFTGKGRIAQIVKAFSTKWTTLKTSAITKLDDFFKPVTKLFSADGAIGKIFARFKQGWTAVKTGFTSGFKSVKLLFDIEKGPVGKIFTAFKNGWTTVKNTAQAAIKGMFAPLKAIFTVGKEGKGGGAISKMVGSVVKAFNFSFGPLIDDIFKPLKAVFQVGAEGKGGGAISRMIGRIVSVIKWPLTVIDNILQPIKNIFGPKGPVGKAVGMFKSAFSALKAGGTLMKALSAVGRVLGRLFFPFTIIMAVWDTIKGAIEGFEKGGIMGLISGALAGLINSLIGMPLDLLKSGVAWIAEKMGFKNAAKFLRSFDITEIIKSIIFNPINFLKMYANSIIETIARAADVVTGGRIGKFLGLAGTGDKIRKFKFDTKKLETKSPETKEREEKKAENLKEIEKKRAKIDARAEEIRRQKEIQERMAPGLKKAGATDAQLQEQNKANQLLSERIKTMKEPMIKDGRKTPPVPETLADQGLGRPGEGTGGGNTMYTDASSHTQSSQVITPPVTPEYTGRRGRGRFKRRWDDYSSYF